MDLPELKRRADEGQADALHELGARLLTGRAAPYSPQHAEALLQRAAEQRHVKALHLLTALRGRRGEWAKALAHLKEAGDQGDASAAEQLALMQGFGAQTWAQPGTIGWRSESPRIGVIESFVPASVCGWIIERARPMLRNARVSDPGSGAGIANDYRSNSGAGFSVLDSDIVLEIVHARIAATIGVPIEFQEPTNVLHYATGEQYRPHFDFVDPGVAQFARELMALGQRTTTFLIYLNDDFEGGETEFPRLDWRFKGKAGDALVFWNVDREGRPERQTLHAGLAPSRGEKWILSKWVRDRPLPLI